MLLKICLAIMLIGKGVYSSEVVEYFIKKISRQLTGMNATLDPRLDEIVLIDGCTLVTGTRKENPYLAMANMPEYRNQNKQASSNLSTLIETSDTAKHFEILKELSVQARNGNYWALSAFEDLFRDSVYSGFRLPWPHKNSERSAWFREIKNLRETQLSSRSTTTQQEEAGLTLRAILQPPENHKDK